MKKILLTSASEIFLKRNSILLRERGFHVLTAKTGAEALRQLEEHQLDLILADLQLTDISGCALCCKMRRSKHIQHVPVILSCLNISGSVERAELSGASAILLKPIDPKKLLDTIGSFIDVPEGRSKRGALNTNILVRNKDFEFLCLSHDISNSGILIETSQQLSPGNRIICKFSLHDSAHIETEAEVISYISSPEREHYYEVRFIDLNVSHRRAIDTYLASTAPLLNSVKHEPLHSPRLSMGRQE